MKRNNDSSFVLAFKFKLKIRFCLRRLCEFVYVDLRNGNAGINFKFYFVTLYISSKK